MILPLSVSTTKGSEAKIRQIQYKMKHGFHELHVMLISKNHKNKVDNRAVVIYIPELAECVIQKSVATNYICLSMLYITFLYI